MNVIESLNIFFDLKLLKKCFLQTTFALLLVILIDGLWIHFKVEPQAEAGSLLTETAAPKIQEPLRVYEAIFEKDTLFGKVAKKADAWVQRLPIAELAKNWRLKGVIFIGEPEAIIENAQTRQTYFIKTGSALGELTVKKIEEGSLELEHGEETITLKIQ